MAKLSTLTLDELYERPKLTRAVEIAIISKSNFETINDKYCETICRLNCKQTNKVKLFKDEVDILIIQDHSAPPGRYDKFEGQQERVQQGVINFIAKQAGFGELTYKIVNLLKCAATAEDFPLGKPPTQTTMIKCFPYLEAEILASKPKVILSLGTAVTKALGLTHFSNTGNRGEITMTDYKCPIVFSLHPRILTFIRQNARGSAGMWGPDYYKIILGEFIKAKKLATGELEYSSKTLAKAVERAEKFQIRVAKSLDDVRQFSVELKALPGDRVVSFDTETTSLDTLDPDLRLLSIQFGWKRDDGTIVAVVIPLFHRDNKYFDAKEAWDIIVWFLLSDHPKVGHNSKYDILAIYWSMGVRVKAVVFDTLLLLHSINSGAQGTYGLKAAVWDCLTEAGLGGYEDMLGDLKDIKKLREKAQGESDVDAEVSAIIEQAQLVLDFERKISDDR